MYKARGHGTVLGLQAMVVVSFGTLGYRYYIIWTVELALVPHTCFNIFGSLLTYGIHDTDRSDHIYHDDTDQEKMPYLAYIGISDIYGLSLWTIYMWSVAMYPDKIPKYIWIISTVFDVQHRTLCIDGCLVLLLSNEVYITLKCPGIIVMYHDTQCDIDDLPLPNDW